MQDKGAARRHPADVRKARARMRWRSNVALSGGGRNLRHPLLARLLSSKAPRPTINVLILGPGARPKMRYLDPRNFPILGFPY
jgi:hypothetical protein